MYHEQQRTSFWSMRLTRTTACLMSLFGPVLLGIPMVMLILLTSALDVDLGDSATTLGVVIFIAAVLVVRVFFARWYVVDKGRNAGWAVIAVVGFWGWVVLWLLADMNVRGAMPMESHA